MTIDKNCKLSFTFKTIDEICIEGGDIAATCIVYTYTNW